MRRLHARAWPPKRAAAEAVPRSPTALGAVRCAWGSAKEATALASVLEALPEATMEEAGLAVLSAEAIPDGELRRAFLAGELPLLGASPDAMLRPAPGAPLEIVEVKNVCELPLRDSNPA